ncbi:WD40-repeat-containing domain protein [Cristinia sonorae]|uniref:WD40-repeat-containing domain protein n=1 Tax=Cristinia sonorae TaxID=1940300 RepID=A0A8K0UG71_9AGAR|nr:WD40-repeat-containing domain protein [Cristinia sonorae]
MSSSIYNHKHLQPAGAGTQPGPPGVGPPQIQHAHGRLNESFENIRTEFDLLAREIDILRGQSDDFENKVTGQVNELNIIRSSLYELETQHGKIRQQYEDEIRSLRAEIALLRQQTSGPPPPREGIASLGRDRDRDQRERERERERDLRERDMREREMRDRDMRERERDRERGPPGAGSERDFRDGRERDRERDRDVQMRDASMRDVRDIRDRERDRDVPMRDPRDARDMRERDFPARDLRADREREMREREMRDRDRDMRDRDRDLRDERGVKRIKTEQSTDGRPRKVDRGAPPSQSQPLPQQQSLPAPPGHLPFTHHIQHMHHPPHTISLGPPPPSNQPPPPTPGGPSVAGTPKLPPAGGGPPFPSTSTPSAAGPSQQTSNGKPMSRDGPGPEPTSPRDGIPPTTPSERERERTPMGGIDTSDPLNVPPELKKEGSDWFAIFNGNESPTSPGKDGKEISGSGKRSLDVGLVHTLLHESVVCCVRFSADGKFLATGCNRTAQIYDTKTGAKTCVLVDEDASKTGDLYIRSVCFSPDGKLLATGAEDKQIRIWDIAKRKIRRIFDGHQQEIYSLDFSRDGRLIVSGSGDRTARIWDMEGGANKILTINEPENVDAGVTSVCISPDGRLVAAGSLDTIVRIWDVVTGQLVERLKGHRDSVYSVAFTPDGRGLVSGSLDKTLKYWDVRPILNKASGSGPEELGGPGRERSGSVNGKNVTDGGEKGSQCTMNFVGHKDYVLSVAVSHDGQWVVSGSKDRGVQFWDAKTAVVQCMLQGHKNSVISIDLNPAGSTLATGSGDWQARIWSYTAL